VKADLKTRVGVVSQALRESSDSLLAEGSDTGAEALDRIRQTGMDAATQPVKGQVALSAVNTEASSRRAQRLFRLGLRTTPSRII